MPYIQRDKHGEIVALTRDTSVSAEFMAANDPLVINFLNDGATKSVESSALAVDNHLSLHRADLEMIRVIEDVIDLLIAKNLLMFSELPAAVQHKLLQKRGQREKLFGAGGGLLTGEDEIL